jgi:hypothetical protein
MADGGDGFHAFILAHAPARRRPLWCLRGGRAPDPGPADHQDAQARPKASALFDVGRCPGRAIVTMIGHAPLAPDVPQLSLVVRESVRRLG